MSLVDELRRLHELHQSGALTDEEYARAKALVLGQPFEDRQGLNTAITPEPSKPGRRESFQPSNHGTGRSGVAARDEESPTALGVLVFISVIGSGLGVALLIVALGLGSGISAPLGAFIGIVCIVSCLFLLVIIALIPNRGEQRTKEGREAPPRAAWADGTPCIRCGRAMPGDAECCPHCDGA